MSRIQLGIVGVGLIWELTHKGILEKLKDTFDIRAFSVRSDKSRNKIEREFPTAEIFNNYQDMIKLGNLDAIVILTPINLNAKISIDVLKAGKNVIVEKPLATNITEVERILQLEKETNRKVFILEQVRYSENLKNLKQIVDGGRIGKIISYELVTHNRIDEDDYSHGGFGNTKWRIEPDFPLGSLFDGGIHTITQLNLLFSKPRSVYTLGTQLRSGFGEYDFISMTFEHNSEICGTLSFSDYMTGGCNYFVIRGLDGIIRYERGKIEILGKNNETLEMPEDDASLAMWKRCADFFGETHSFSYGSKEALEDVETLEAVDRSLKTGEKVTIR